MLQLHELRENNIYTEINRRIFFIKGDYVIKQYKKCAYCSEKDIGLFYITDERTRNGCNITHKYAVIDFRNNKLYFGDEEQKTISEDRLVPRILDGKFAIENGILYGDIFKIKQEMPITFANDIRLGNGKNKDIIDILE